MTGPPTPRLISPSPGWVCVAESQHCGTNRQEFAGIRGYLGPKVDGLIGPAQNSWRFEGVAPLLKIVVSPARIWVSQITALRAQSVLDERRGPPSKTPRYPQATAGISLRRAAPCLPQSGASRTIDALLFGLPMRIFQGIALSRSAARSTLGIEITRLKIVVSPVRVRVSPYAANLGKHWGFADGTYDAMCAGGRPTMEVFLSCKRRLFGNVLCAPFVAPASDPLSGSVSLRQRFISVSITGNSSPARATAYV